MIKKPKTIFILGVQFAKICQKQNNAVTFITNSVCLDPFCA